MKLVKLTGVRGVGKTSIIEELKVDSEIVASIGFIHSSKELTKLSFEICKRPLESLSGEDLFRVQEALIRNTKNMPQKIVVFDTHNVKIEQKTGKVIILTPYEHRKVFDCYILIEAEPEVIMARRQADNNMKRDHNLELIVTEINAEREESRQMAAETGANLYIVKNNVISGAAEEIKRILRREFE